MNVFAMYLALTKNYCCMKKINSSIIFLLRIKCFSILFLILSSSVLAQNKTLTGTVEKSETSEPVANASVRVKVLPRMLILFLSVHLH